MIRNYNLYIYFNLIICTIALIFISCTQYIDYAPDPEKDVEKWIDNFANQRSFTYHYAMKTTAVHTEARGECLIGIGEHVFGIWQGNDQELEFEYYGLFDLEYEKQNGQWQEAIRGEQTEILIQIERVLEFDEFEYLPESAQYTYRFKANAAFLSPVRRKEMIGEIKFSPKDYRPVWIWAGLPDSSAYWTVILSDYNRIKSIRPPVMKWQKHLLNKEITYSLIKKRLTLLDIPYHIRRRDQKIELEVPAYLSKDELRRYFSDVELTVSRVVENREDAKRVVELGAKGSRAYVGEIIFGNSDIKDCQVKYDGISRPFLVLTLKKPLDFTRHLLLEISDGTKELILIDNQGKMNKIKLYFNKTFYDMFVLRAQVLYPFNGIELNF